MTNSDQNILLSDNLENDHQEVHNLELQQELNAQQLQDIHHQRQQLVEVDAPVQQQPRVI